MTLLASIPIILGFTLLIRGASWLVEGASVLALGVSSVITPLPVSTAFNRDIATMVASFVLLLLLIQPGPLVNRRRFWRAQTGHVLTRTEGGILFILYGVHIAVTVVSSR